MTAAIVETEGYLGRDDPTSHAHLGPTAAAAFAFPPTGRCGSPSPATRPSRSHGPGGPPGWVAARHENGGSGRRGRSVSHRRDRRPQRADAEGLLDHGAGRGVEEGAR